MCVCVNFTYYTRLIVTYFTLQYFYDSLVLQMGIQHKESFDKYVIK